MEIAGTIKRIFNIDQISEKFKIRKFVIKTDDQYPQTIEFQLSQDKVSLLDKHSEGDEIAVHFNLRGREHEGRVYNTLDAWRITGVSNSPPQDSVTRNEKDYKKPDWASQGDELPF